MPPSLGASALPALAPPPPAWSTARAIGEEGDRAPIRATIAASCRSWLPTVSWRAGDAAIGRREPERAAIAVLAGRDALDAEDDEAAVGRQLRGRWGREGRTGPRGAGRGRPSVDRSPACRVRLSEARGFAWPSLVKDRCSAAATRRGRLPAGGATSSWRWRPRSRRPTRASARRRWRPCSRRRRRSPPGGSGGRGRRRR